jgi:membrane associated rhomboid family serine protease
MEKNYEKPNLTYFFILVFVVIFILQLYYTFIYGEDFINELFYNYGFSLQNVLDGRIEVFLTSVFLHGDASHLILNMVALFFFGRVVEQELGRKKFLIIFFMSAIVGNMAVLSSTLLGFGSAVVPTIGASAAIFGLIGTGMLVKPFEFVFYPYLIPIPLILVALIYTIYNIAELLLVILEGASSNISYVSHLGGLIAGMIFGFRQEGSRRGLIVLLFLLLLLILTPFMLIIFNYLEIFNYVAFLSQAFG